MCVQLCYCDLICFCKNIVSVGTMVEKTYDKKFRKYTIIIATVFLCMILYDAIKYLFLQQSVHFMFTESLNKYDIGTEGN